MREVIKEVKTKEQGIVATLTLPQYETLDEALGNLKPEDALSMINRMVVTDAMNKERALHRPGTVTKQRRNTLAMQLAFKDKDLKKELVALMGGDDEVALQAFLTSAAVQALVDDAIAKGAQ